MQALVRAGGQPTATPQQLLGQAYRLPDRRRASGRADQRLYPATSIRCSSASLGVLEQMTGLDLAERAARHRRLRHPGHRHSARQHGARHGAPRPTRRPAGGARRRGRGGIVAAMTARTLHGRRHRALLHRGDGGDRRQGGRSRPAPRASTARRCPSSASASRSRSTTARGRAARGGDGRGAAPSRRRSTRRPGRASQALPWPRIWPTGAGTEVGRCAPRRGQPA